MDFERIIKMEMTNMYYLFVFVIILNVVSVLCGPEPEEEHLCCHSDQYLVRQKSISYCYKPKLNVITPISLECANATVVITKSQINYSVNSHGKLLLSFNNFETEHESGKFCLSTLMSSKNRSKLVPAALLCDEQEVQVIGEEPIGYCMMVSCLFLSITAIIYIALPELRDLQGISIINLCVSLTLGFGILAAMKLLPYSDMTLCAIRGFLVYFFILAGFFWMNVISIQIMLKMRRPTISSYKWKEFLYYAGYAWGAPAVLTAAVATVNFMPGDHIKPGIGLNDCWFFRIGIKDSLCHFIHAKGVVSWGYGAWAWSAYETPSIGTKQQWQYMYSVMSILIIANICIFVYSSVVLWKNTFNSKQHKMARYKFSMTVRLAIVMGVPWLFEMLGTVSSHIIWEILDIVNSLQGVYIFLIVVVLRRRAMQVMYRHGWLRCVAGPAERCLAVGDNDEDEAEHTTLGIPLESVRE